MLESLSRLFRLLGDTNRLRILFAIGKEQKSVTEIMNETSLPQTLVSFHLRRLRESGVLTAERKGPFVYYRVSDPGLIDLLVSLGGHSPSEEVQEKPHSPWPPMRFMKSWIK